MLFLFFGIVFAQTKDVLEEASSKFEVPSFSSHQLVVQGQDLFSITGSQNGLDSIDGQLSLIYTKASQTPSETLQFGASSSGYLTTSGSHTMNIAAESLLAVNRQKYYKNTTGFFTSQRAAFGAGKIGRNIPIADGMTGLGIGYGRVLDIRILIQAKTMFELLQKKYTEKELRNLAELIGRRGEYIQKYKFDSDIYFYNDLAEALGGATT